MDTKRKINIRDLEAPVAAVPSFNLNPEFVDAEGLYALFGVRRTHAYELIKRRQIRSVSLRAPGRLRGRRLFDVASVRAYLLSQVDAQTPEDVHLERTEVL